MAPSSRSGPNPEVVPASTSRSSTLERFKRRFASRSRARPRHESRELRRRQLALCRGHRAGQCDARRHFRFAGVRGGTLSGDLNTSTNALAIATGTGPLAFGDSIVSTVTDPGATNDRVPNGFLDDVQLYDRVLTDEEIRFLFSNPGEVVNPIIPPIEFFEDDEPGFDLWPSAIVGTSSTADFASDPTITSGTTTVTITTSTAFGSALNRGSIDGTPPGYSYQHLYEDSLIATSPTGFLTLNVSGLNAGETYRFHPLFLGPGSMPPMTRSGR